MSFGNGFHDAHKRSILTFSGGPFFQRNSHNLQCNASIHEYSKLPNGFPCSYAASWNTSDAEEAKWGIFASRKAHLPNVGMLDLTRASQVWGSFFALWACTSL